MSRNSTARQFRRILVVIPNWVGDVVLASPTLAALREHFRRARITYLLRRYVAEVVDGCGWHNELMFWPQQRGPARELRSLDLAGRLRAERFDLAILLTNSFRAALVTAMARIPHRLGYARDGRSWLLTDRLRPLKRQGRFVPSSVLPYYAGLAEHLGCPVADRAPRLGVSLAQQRRGEELMRAYGLNGGRPYVIINPGAKFGAAKCWLPERFAELCDHLARVCGLRPVIVGAPEEYPLMRDIAARTREAVVCCDKPGTTLGSLKTLVREARLVICNDTGPRHYAIAFGRPVVTIFGPTHQEWTDTGYRDEIKLQAGVPCGPCQLSECPLDLRCMTAITTRMVAQAAEKLLARTSEGGGPPAGQQEDVNAAQRPNVD